MKFLTSDTICAPATIPGTGAITVIRVSGPDTLAIADKVIQCKRGPVSGAEGYSIVYGAVYDGTRLIDEVLVSVFKAPHSYTGEDSVEISCHASAYICSEVLRLLVCAGARLAEPGEFTRRAYVNGKMDLAQAEAVADVIASTSEASHRLALNQLKGGISSELKDLRAQLLELTSLLELELDFSEEDVEFADRTRLMTVVSQALERIGRLAASFKDGNAIRNGVPVAIVGATNAGKSTLLNALVGHDRAIVSDIAGTTRDTVEETMVLDGLLYRFIDTAGLRETSEKIEAIGIERSLKAMSEADVVIVTVDANCAALKELKEIVSKVDTETQSLIVALNKADLVTDISGLADSIDVAGALAVVPVSAKLGDGLDALKAAISLSQRRRTYSEGTMVSNMRHYEALLRAGESLSRVRDGLTSGLASDLVAQDLRDVLWNLGSITGEISADEVLGEIFGKFCIGK